MKISTHVVLKDFSGKKYTETNENGTQSDLTLGLAIARVLTTRQKSPDPLRDNVLAVDFYSNAEVDLNDSDKEYIENACKDSGYFSGVIGAIISEFKK